MDHLFCTSVFTDRVKLQPSQLNAGYGDFIARQLRRRNEGRCTPNGYVRTGSLKVLRISAGRVETRMLNGDVTFTVQFKCSVCNLSKGCVIVGKVMNTNRFAALAGCTVDGAVVVDAIIPKQSTSVASVADVNELRVGDAVRMEVMGAKYELNDSKIKAVARVLDKGSGEEELLGTTASTKGEEEEEGAAVDVEERREGGQEEDYVVDAEDE